MAPDILNELYAEQSRGSPARLAFTQRAFEMLPDLDNPRILDVGCGQGGPTLVLARLSGGHVTGLDIDQAALDELSGRAGEAGLSGRIEAVHGSMVDMDFAAESFDVIWAEGSMHVLGFERALEEWRRFIKPGGFLVIHETAWLRPDPPAELVHCPQLAYPGISTVSEYIERVPDHGYDLVGHFVLPEDFWLADYAVPIVARIGELRTEYAGDRAAQKTLDNEQQAAELLTKYADWYGSVYLVMKKRAREAGRA
jgi:SAM-dependent methyltransferase